MSAGIQRPESPEDGPLLRVQVTFHVSDERKAQALAAQMVDRAHEIANLPDSECDVDVSVEWVAASEDVALSVAGGGPARVPPGER